MVVVQAEANFEAGVKTGKKHPPHRYRFTGPLEPQKQAAIFGPFAASQGGSHSQEHWYRCWDILFSFGPLTSSRWEIGWGMYSKFGKPLKRAIRTCMGQGWVAAIKSDSRANKVRSGIFWPFPSKFQEIWGVHTG